MEQAKHWSDDITLSSRAFFKYNEEPSKLNIDGVKDFDGGAYRCRVDFKNSPSRNQRVNLTVILPPEKLSVLNDQGLHISHYILGPYNEGSSIDIICVATGGRPSPRVTWWQENTLLDDTFEQLSEKRVRNVLRLENLQRKNLNTVYTCQASNNNLIAPISSAITLNLNLKPLFVRLEGENRPLSAENSYDLSCNVIGARPAPMITWWKGSTEMKNTKEITSSDLNITTSILKYVPTVDDHGKFLSCRAIQPIIPDSGIEDGWKLNIYYTPIVYLELGSNLNSSIIREGDDVYFECNIKSNPWVYKVSWRHNGKILYNNAALGTIVSNQSLVLQNVNRSRAGLYTCIGSNQEGDGESNSVKLDIKFAPVCRPGQNKVYGVAKHESIKIPCDVEANPTNLNFSWKFNNSFSKLSHDLKKSSIVVDQTRSVAAFVPTQDSDYGPLLCWSSNEIGVQIDPCVFYVVPAGKPDSLSNCSILNQSIQSLQIECTDNYDGGLPQLFLIEVFDSHKSQLFFNMTSKSPQFNIDGLKSGLEFLIELSAFNEKGKSEPFKLQAYTLKSAERHIASIPLLIEMAPFVGAIIGTVTAIVFCVFVTTMIVKCRRCRKSVRNKDFNGSGGGNNGIAGAISARGGVSYSGQTGVIGHLNTSPSGICNDKTSCEPFLNDRENSENVEEQNPDIIPPHLCLDGDYDKECLTTFERLNNIFPRSYHKINSPQKLFNNYSYEFYNTQLPNELAYAELSLLSQTHPHVIFKQQTQPPSQQVTLNGHDSVMFSPNISTSTKSASPHVLTLNSTLRRSQRLGPSFVLRQPLESQNDYECALLSGTECGHVNSKSNNNTNSTSIAEMASSTAVNTSPALYIINNSSSSSNSISNSNNQHNTKTASKNTSLKSTTTRF